MPLALVRDLDETGPDGSPASTVTTRLPWPSGMNGSKTGPNSPSSTSWYGRSGGGLSPGTYALSSGGAWPGIFTTPVSGTGPDRTADPSASATSTPYDVMSPASAEP
ncbi:hypothetical protein ABZY16_24045 [Streptomyces sp. NPDC006553]|uniref:hypothetical protein n=1 Tax=Streptomyces sp. NPDC006553 TaxID=3157180 RepID=UPI0033A27BE9